MTTALCPHKLQQKKKKQQQQQQRTKNYLEFPLATRSARCPLNPRLGEGRAEAEGRVKDSTKSKQNLAQGSVKGTRACGSTWRTDSGGDVCGGEDDDDAGATDDDDDDDDEVRSRISYEEVLNWTGILRLEMGERDWSLPGGGLRREITAMYTSIFDCGVSFTCWDVHLNSYYRFRK